MRRPKPITVARVSVCLLLATFALPTTPSLAVETDELLAVASDEAYVGDAGETMLDAESASAVADAIEPVAAELSSAEQELEATDEQAPEAATTFEADTDEEVLPSDKDEEASEEAALAQEASLEEELAESSDPEPNNSLAPDAEEAPDAVDIPNEAPDEDDTKAPSDDKGSAPSSPDDPNYYATPTPPKNGWWDDGKGNRYYYVNGKPKRSEEFYDKQSGQWYWFAANGVMARDKDIFLSKGKRWVRYDQNGHMVKGELCRQSEKDGAWHWYYFDEVDGTMRKGFVHLNSNGGKWCYYDPTWGWMLFGQQYLRSDNGVMNWYLFHKVTGAVQYGWQDIKEQNKRVFYDRTWGWMLKGTHVIDGRPWHFDVNTGACLSKQDLVARLLAAAASQDGTESGYLYEATLCAAGGSTDPYGPCLAFVWWCFNQAGLRLNFCDGLVTAWPHDVCNWYNERGRLMHKDPAPGDIWLTNQIGGGPDGATATHAGIIASNPYVINGVVYVDVWEHVNGWVHLQRENAYWYDHQFHLYNGTIAGYARPYYNE